MALHEMSANTTSTCSGGSIVLQAGAALSQGPPTPAHRTDGAKHWGTGRSMKEASTVVRHEDDNELLQMAPELSPEQTPGSVHWQTPALLRYGAAAEPSGLAPPASTSIGWIDGGGGDSDGVSVYRWTLAARHAVGASGKRLSDSELTKVVQMLQRTESALRALRLNEALAAAWCTLRLAPNCTAAMLLAAVATLADGGTCAYGCAWLRIAARADRHESVVAGATTPAALAASACPGVASLDPIALVTRLLQRIMVLEQHRGNEHLRAVIDLVLRVASRAHVPAPHWDVVTTVLPAELAEALLVALDVVNRRDTTLSKN